MNATSALCENSQVPSSYGTVCDGVLGNVKIGQFLLSRHKSCINIPLLKASSMSFLLVADFMMSDYNNNEINEPTGVVNNNHQSFLKRNTSMGTLQIPSSKCLIDRKEQG